MTPRASEPEPPNLPGSAARRFEQRFTNVCLSSRRTMYGSDDVVHQATLLRLEPVGQSLWHRRTAADLSCGAGVGPGPDQPRSHHDPARLTRTTTSPTTVLICLSSLPLTSPESLWNRAISEAEVRILDQLNGLGHCSECDVTRIIAVECDVTRIIAVAPLLHRTGSGLIEGTTVYLMDLPNKTCRILL